MTESHLGTILNVLPKALCTQHQLSQQNDQFYDSNRWIFVSCDILADVDSKIFNLYEWCEKLHFSKLKYSNVVDSVAESQYFPVVSLQSQYCPGVKFSRLFNLLFDTVNEYRAFISFVRMTTLKENRIMKNVALTRELIVQNLLNSHSSLLNSIGMKRK